MLGGGARGPGTVSGQLMRHGPDGRGSMARHLVTGNKRVSPWQSAHKLSTAVTASGTPWQSVLVSAKYICATQNGVCLCNTVYRRPMARLVVARRRVREQASLAAAAAASSRFLPAAEADLAPLQVMRPDAVQTCAECK